MPAIPASRILRETHFAGLEPSARGKVRDIYDLADKLLIVATDRLSAFDVILPTPIPDKGRVLTQLSLFWFDLFKDVIHLGRGARIKRFAARNTGQFVQNALAFHAE